MVPVRGRTRDQWWGLAVEAPDPVELASFYSELLGWPVVEQQAGLVVLKPPQESTYLVFQDAPGYTPPVWPPAPGAQRPMMHLDFRVTDLEAAVQDATALGAELVEHQPQAHVQVMRDPAGHVFCLCLDKMDDRRLGEVAVSLASTSRGRRVGSG